MIGIGAYAMALPSFLVRFAQPFIRSPGLWVAFLLRILLATALWFAAAESRTPTTFRIFGAVTLLGAMALPLMGSARLEALVRWGSRQPAWVIRGVCGIVIVFGLFLFWSSTLGWRSG
ncbi:MAG: hypothetical protein OEN50_05460 [Deltaproteobacteria bacterium]|nr:hypothetical protein [Deltaproteobacteria bacterium]